MNLWTSSGVYFPINLFIYVQRDQISPGRTRRSERGKNPTSRVHISPESRCVCRGSRRTSDPDLGSQQDPGGGGAVGSISWCVQEQLGVFTPICGNDSKSVMKQSKGFYLHDRDTVSLYCGIRILNQNIILNQLNHKINKQNNVCANAAAQIRRHRFTMVVYYF